jgi:uncharacterized protein YegL
MSKAEENGTSGDASDGVLHVAFVLDRSGSMQGVAEAVVEGYNDYLGELRGQGGDTFYSLTTFNTDFEHVCVGDPLERVPELDYVQYRPDGMTALYDAIAHTVIETDRRLQSEGRGEEKVLVVVMTDGLENSSTDYDAHAIAQFIRGYNERPNWTFVYLGAGHANITDAQHAAAGMGYQSANAMLWSADPVSTRKSMRSLADATRARRGSVLLKSESFFADAGQSAADYRQDTPEQDPRRRQSSPRPRRSSRSATIHRQDLGDVLPSSGRPSRGGDSLPQEAAAGRADR